MRDLIAWLSFLTIQQVDRPGTGILPFAVTAGRERFGWATPIGGSIALPRALQRFIRRHGGHVVAGKRVTDILVEGGRARAVRTEDGERFEARRAVLSSAHLVHVAEMISGCEVPDGLLAARDAWRPGLSLFAVHLALRGQLSYPTAHGRLPAVAGGLGSLRGLLAQLAAFRSGASDAPDPWLLIVCPTVVDPGRAPGGGGTAKLLTVAPYSMDREEDRDRYAAQLIERASTAAEGMSGGDVLAVVAEGPHDIERRNRHNLGGSGHGGEMLGAHGETLVGWPSYRLPVPGLYQTGATTHPGGSVAGRAGRNAARVLLSDLGLDWTAVMGRS